MSFLSVDHLQLLVRLWAGVFYHRFDDGETTTSNPAGQINLASIRVGNSDTLFTSSTAGFFDIAPNARHGHRYAVQATAVSEPRFGSAARNPLCPAFGAVLRRLRNEGRQISAVTAEKLGLSASSYRMIEAGAANVQPALALRISLIYPDLDQQALAVFVVLADHLWSPPPKDMDDLHLRLAEAREHFPSYASVAAILEAQPHVINWPSKDFADHALTRAIDVFLRSNPTRGTTDLKDEYLHRFSRECQQLSPLLLDSALGMFRTLRGVKFRFTTSELYDFEAEHKNDFKRIYAVVTDPELFVNSTEHSGRAAYGYLISEFFLGLTVIVRGQCDPDQVRSRFITELAATFKRRQMVGASRTAFRKACEKIRVWSEVQMMAPDKREVLDQILLHDNVKQQNFWLYELTTTKVGFIDGASTRDAPNPNVQVTGELLALDALSKRSESMLRLIAHQH